jgi:hypothetical protein
VENNNNNGKPWEREKWTLPYTGVYGKVQAGPSANPDDQESTEA